jgi:hypothetical protein
MILLVAIVIAEVLALAVAAVALDAVLRWLFRH